MQGLLGHNIHFAAQQRFKVYNEAGWEPWRMVWLSGHQKVHITVRTSLSPSSRAKDAHIARSMLGSNAEDFPSFGLYSLINAHRTATKDPCFQQYTIVRAKRQTIFCPYDPTTSIPWNLGDQDQAGFLQQLNCALGETGQAAIKLIELRRDGGLVCPIKLQRADQSQGRRLCG